jgi:lipopolysaccharide biosynthesis glycosyltransferase
MIHIACAADENYAPHCAAMLHSVLSLHAPEQVTIHFLHGPRLDREVLRRLTVLVEGMRSHLDLIEIADEAVAGLQKRGQVAGVMWYRVFLPERLPDLDRILYLDADTLVVDSLQPLWETNLSDVYAAAVSNDLTPRLRHRPLQLGLREPADYFNSGVLLMNLDKLRRDAIGGKVLTYARSNRRLMWQDQDPLNVVFDGRWRKLHPRWNCQSSLYYYDHGVRLFGSKAVDEAREHPAIVHFEGPDALKPWHYLSKHPYRAQYLAHRVQTPWGEFTPMGQTLKNRILRLLPVKVMLRLSDVVYRGELRLRRKVASMRAVVPAL